MSNLRTVIVTDHNDQEGEDFSFVLELSENQIKSIQEEIDNMDEPYLSMIVDADISDETIEIMEKTSSNGYMSRIARYELPKDFEYPDEDETWYDDVFYKGIGLDKKTPN